VALSVSGETLRFVLDYAGAGGRATILAETTPTSRTLYIYGRQCLGEVRDGTPLYYLNDTAGHVRQGADASGAIVSTWLFDPDGTVLEGPDGPVSHLVCGGVYDGSTGLIYRDGHYFDPNLGIWLALMPLLVVQGWRKRKERRQWVLLLCVGLFAVGSMAGCGSTSTPDPTCTTSPSAGSPGPGPRTPGIVGPEDGWGPSPLPGTPGGSGSGEGGGETPSPSPGGPGGGGGSGTPPPPYPQCKDFAPKIRIDTISQPHWLVSKSMYGLTVNFVVESDPATRTCEPLRTENAL